jgi:hypothetical protein
MPQTTGRRARRAHRTHAIVSDRQAERTAPPYWGCNDSPGVIDQTGKREYLRLNSFDFVTTFWRAKRKTA